MKIAVLTDEERAKLQFLNELLDMRQEAFSNLQLYKRRLFEKHFPESRDPFSKKWHLDESGKYIISE